MIHVIVVLTSALVYLPDAVSLELSDDEDDAEYSITADQRPTS